MSPLSAASMRSFSRASAASARLISAFEAVPWPERSPFPPAVESAVCPRRSLVRAAADELFVLRGGADARARGRVSRRMGGCKEGRSPLDAAGLGSDARVEARGRPLPPRQQAGRGSTRPRCAGVGRRRARAASVRSMPHRVSLGQWSLRAYARPNASGLPGGSRRAVAGDAISPAWSGGPRAAPRGRRRPGSSRPGRDARRRARRSRRPARGPGQTSRPPWPPAPPPPRPR